MLKEIFRKLAGLFLFLGMSFSWMGHVLLTYPCSQTCLLCCCASYVMWRKCLSWLCARGSVSHFKPVQVGLVPGMQTITRAECLAVTQIVRSVSTARIYSDSAAAGDILKRFEVVKIKAHGQDTEAICDWDLDMILGNRFADMSAKAYSHRITVDRFSFLGFLQIFILHSTACWRTSCNAWLKWIDSGWTKFQRQVVVLNRLGLSQGLFRQWVIVIFAYLIFLIHHSRLFRLFLFSWIGGVVRWARMIQQWPISDDVPGGSISYGELIVNLLLVTQRPLPRIVNKGTNGFVECGDPVVSNQFLLLPWTMDESVTLMHHVVNFLFKYFNIEIFPLETQRETFDALGFQTYCFWVSAATSYHFLININRFLHRWLDTMAGILQRFRRWQQILCVQNILIW